MYEEAYNSKTDKNWISI